MSLADAEIPDNQVGKESLGPVSRLNRRVYLAVITVLGAVLIIGVLGWLLLAFNNKSMPDGLSVILGTVAGALVALISDNPRA
jgi:hypothetical protein